MTTLIEPRHLRLTEKPNASRNHRRDDSQSKVGGIDKRVFVPIMPFPFNGKLDRFGQFEVPPFSGDLGTEGGAFVSAEIYSEKPLSWLTGGISSVNIPVCLGRDHLVCKTIQQQLESMFEN